MTISIQIRGVLVRGSKYCHSYRQSLSLSKLWSGMAVCYLLYISRVSKCLFSPVVVCKLLETVPLMNYTYQRKNRACCTVILQNIDLLSCVLCVLLKLAWFSACDVQFPWNVSICMTTKFIHYSYPLCVWTRGISDG